MCIHMTTHLHLTQIQNERKNICHNTICTSAHKENIFIFMNKILLARNCSLNLKAQKSKYVNSHFSHCASSMCASAPVKMNEILEGIPAATSQPWCLRHCMLSFLISSPSRHCPVLQPPACLARQTDYTSSSSNHIWYIKSGSRNRSSGPAWPLTVPLLTTSSVCRWDAVVFPYNSMLPRIIR